ncbi:MAG: class I SAM-dependent methyltransferase [Candidatus Poribacteria bacterium]|nr:class I SAM-dependent methyltransferase [Candidatus Poribacteria bacterium]
MSDRRGGLPLDGGACYGFLIPSQLRRNGATRKMRRASTHSTRAGYAWYEEERFWEYYLPLLMSRADTTHVSPEIDATLERLNIREGGAVLDLGCGIGRHALELARRGYRVTGVDRTAQYLELARARAESDDLAASFVVDDMRDFVQPGAFDGVVSLFTSFGYFQDPDDDRRVIQNVYESLKPGGSFVLDVQGKEIITRKFAPREWSSVFVGGREILVLEEREIQPNWSGISSRWIFIEEERRGEFTVIVRLYSAMEMIALLKSCGFASVEVYGSLSGDAYDQDAKRLVAVGRKA